MQVDNPKELNFILGHSHFIKTVEVLIFLDTYLPLDLVTACGKGELQRAAATKTRLPCRLRTFWVALRCWIALVQDIYEGLVQSGMALKFGIAFCEASGGELLQAGYGVFACM